MNPITHLLVSWTVAETAPLDDRDRAIAAWAGIAPDLDGLGALPDLIARALGYGDPAYYGRFHHALLHGAFGAVLISAAGGLCARRRWSAFGWSLLAIHVHFLCDLVGSRGPTPDDIWPVPYLAPFGERLTFAWSGQWALNAWQNILLTLLLICFVFFRAVTAGRSPVTLFGKAAGEVFVETVRARWRRLRRSSPGTEG